MIYELSNVKYYIIERDYDLIPDKSVPFEKKIKVVNNVIDENTDIVIETFQFHKTNNNFINPCFDAYFIEPEETEQLTSEDTKDSGDIELEKLKQLYEEQEKQGLSFKLNYEESEKEETENLENKLNKKNKLNDKMKDKNKFNDKINDKINDKNKLNDKNKNDKHKNEDNKKLETKKEKLQNFYDKLILTNLTPNNVLNILSFKKMYIQSSHLYKNIHVFYSFGDSWFELSNGNLHVNENENAFFHICHGLLKSSEYMKKKTKHYYSKGFKYTFKTSSSSVIMYVIFKEELKKNKN